MSVTVWFSSQPTQISRGLTEHIGKLYQVLLLMQGYLRMIPLAHGHLLVRPLSQGNRPGSRYIPVFRLKIMCQQSIVQHARLDYWEVSRTNNQRGCRVSTQPDTPGYGFVFSIPNVCSVC